jgi:hypothetical protein
MKFQEAFTARDEGGMNAIPTAALAFTNAIRGDNGGRKAGCVEARNHLKTSGIARGKTNVASGGRTMGSLVSNLESGNKTSIVKVFNMPENGEIRGSIGLRATVHMSTKIAIRRDLMNTEGFVKGGAGDLLSAEHGIESMEGINIKARTTQILSKVVTLILQFRGEGRKRGTTRRTMHTRIEGGVILQGENGGKAAQNVSIVKETKVIGKDSGFTVGRKIGIKLANDHKVIFIKIRHEIGEHSSGVIFKLGGGIDISSGTEIFVELGVDMESR